jgi:hypothetical protein
MIKIKNEQGKTLFLVRDDATEPEILESFSICSAHQTPVKDCPRCHVQVQKEGE